MKDLEIRHPELAKVFLKPENCSQEAYDAIIRISSETGAILMTPQVFIAGLVEAGWVTLREALG